MSKRNFVDFVEHIKTDNGRKVMKNLVLIKSEEQLTPPPPPPFENTVQQYLFTKLGTSTTEILKKFLHGKSPLFELPFPIYNIRTDFIWSKGTRVCSSASDSYLT